MKKVLFCIMISSALSLVAMHDYQGPDAYALFKKMMCYSGFCNCGLNGCKYQKFIPQEKIEQATIKTKLPTNRSLRN